MISANHTKSSDLTSPTTQVTSTQPTTTITEMSTVKITEKNPNRIEDIASNYELEYQEPCRKNQYKEEFLACNTWNRTLCDSPCNKARCPDFAKCKDASNDTHPLFECACQLGMEMKEDSQACIAPQTLEPTPR